MFQTAVLGSLYACLGSPDDVLVHPVNSVGEHASQSRVKNGYLIGRKGSKPPKKALFTGKSTAR